MTPLMRQAVVAAREWSPKGVARMIALAEQDQDRSVAFRATEYLLNRVYGAPSQPVVIDGESRADVTLLSQAALLQEALKAIEAMAGGRAEPTVIEASSG